MPLPCLLAKAGREKSEGGSKVRLLAKLSPLHPNPCTLRTEFMKAPSSLPHYLSTSVSLFLSESREQDGERGGRLQTGEPSTNLLPEAPA